MICLAFLVGWWLGLRQARQEAKRRALWRTIPYIVPFPADPVHPAETIYIN